MQTTTVRPSTYQSMRSFATNAAGDDEDDRIESATREWLASLDSSDMAGYMYPLARAQMRNIMRGFDRDRLQKATTDDWSIGGEALSNPCSRIMLRDTFLWVPGEARRVAFLRMTEAQHIARAEWQESKAAGSIADANRCREAAKLIREGGVTCLEELPDNIGS